MSRMPGNHIRSRGPILRPQDRLPRPPSPQERQLASQQTRAANIRKTREAIFKETGVRIGGGRVEEEQLSVDGVFAEALEGAVDNEAETISSGEQDNPPLGEIQIIPAISNPILEVRQGDGVVEAPDVPPQAARKPFWERVANLFNRLFRRR